MAAGEQLTFPYLQSPSRARLLTSFGFVASDTPAASLLSAGLDEGCLSFRTAIFAPYRDSPYKQEWARLNGRTALVQAELPERDLAWLAGQGCTAPWRTDLQVPTKVIEEGGPSLVGCMVAV
jgi:hypothetical protein